MLGHKSLAEFGHQIWVVLVQKVGLNNQKY